MHFLMRSNALCLALGIILLACKTYGQTPQDKIQLETAIKSTSSGDVSAWGIERIARAGAVEEIPVLEAHFPLETDPAIKLKIASGLVRLGDKDNTYWNFLLQQATLAVDSDLPDPFHDSQGNMIGNKQLSPEFKAWIEAHHVDVSTAVVSWTYGLPGNMALLAETGDQRGIPLLRRALQSHNYLIVVWAAKGLALIQDKESIPLIKAAIQRDPPQFTSLIAESLVYFNDPLAQSTVDNYMPKEKAKMAREEKARGRGVFGW